MKAAEVTGKIKEWLAELAKALAEGNTQGFLGYLERMGRFHRYSARNVALILLQRPDATLVAGIKHWNKLGRKVRAGERGIAILAPTLKRVEVRDEETGEIRLEQQVVGFHTTYVFDISQTEGKPLAQAEPEIPGGAELYNRLRAACPVPVVESLLPPGVYGKTNGQRILLSAEESSSDKAATLLHEWAHVVLHFGGERQDRQTKELEAEATAYAVGRSLGLPMQSSRDYILRWQGTVEGLEASLERIAGAARAILERVASTEQPVPA